MLFRLKRLKKVLFTRESKVKRSTFCKFPKQEFHKKVAVGSNKNQKRSLLTCNRSKLITKKKKRFLRANRIAKSNSITTRFILGNKFVPEEKRNS